MNNKPNNLTNQNNQRQQPSGKILLESLRTTHVGFFGLHLLTQSLLSRALGFSFTLGPRYYEKQQKIKQNKNDATESKSANNDNDDRPENFNDTDIDDDVSFFKKNLSFRDILDVAVIGIPISVEDVTHSARTFLQQPDYERVLRFAICNLVADRRFGVVADNNENTDNNNNNTQHNNDDFEREVSQGISLCKTIFNFVVTGNRTRMGLPNSWGEGLIRMTRSRIFVCVTKLLCRGLFLADWEEKIRPPLDDNNINNFISQDIFDGTSNSNVLTFPLSSHQEIEHLLAKEQKRIHASSVTFSASQTEFMRNSIAHTHTHKASSSPFASASSSTAFISASAANNNNNNVNAPHHFSFLLLCPEVYSLFPSDEGHFLRTTQEGLLHDAMNSFSIDDGIPLIDPWRQEAKMLLVSLRLLNEEDEEGDDIDNDDGDNNKKNVHDDVGDDDDTNYHSMSTFGSGSLVFSTKENQSQLPKKYRKVGFTDVDATSLGRVIRSIKRKQQESTNNNNNNNNKSKNIVHGNGDHENNNKISNPSTFYSGLESLRAFLNVVVSGNSLIHKKAAAIMTNKNKSNENDDSADTSPQQQQQHLQFLKKLFTHPISAKREKILEVNLISPQIALGEKNIKMLPCNDNDKNAAVFFELPNLVSSDHESSNAKQLGLEIVWDPEKFSSSPSRKKYGNDNDDDDDDDDSESSASTSSSTVSTTNNHHKHRQTNVTNNFSIPLLRELVQRCFDLLPFDERTESIPTCHESENNSNNNNDNSNNNNNSTRTFLRENRQRELVREPSLASTIRPPSTIAISSSSKKQLVRNDTDDDENSSHHDDSHDDEENDHETRTASSAKRNLHIFKQYPHLRSQTLIEECGFPLPGRKFSHTIFDSTTTKNSTNNKDSRTNDDEQSREEFLRNPARSSRMTQIEEFWDSTNTKTKSKRLKSRRRRQKMRANNTSNASSTSSTLSSSASVSSANSLASSIDSRYGTGDNKDFLEALESSCAPLRLDLTQQVKLLTSSLDTFSLRATMEQLLINFPKMKIAVGGLNDNERRDILTYSFQNVSFVSAPLPTCSNKHEDKVGEEEDQKMTNNNDTFHDNTTIMMKKPDNWFDSSSSSSSSSSSNKLTNSSSSDDDDDVDDSSEEEGNNNGDADADDDESSTNSSADQFSSLLRHCGVAEILTQFETFPNPKFIPFTPCVENLSEFTKALLSGSYSNQIILTINSADQETKQKMTKQQQQKRDPPQFNFYVAEILLCGLLKSIPLGQACSVVDLCFRILSTFLIQNEKFIQQMNPQQSALATQSNIDIVANISEQEQQQQQQPNADANTEATNNSNNLSNDQTNVVENKNQPHRQSSVPSVASSSPTNVSSLHYLRQSPSNIEQFRAEFLFETGVMQLFPLLASYALIIKTLLTSLKNSEEISALQKERGHAAPYQQQNDNSYDRKKKKQEAQQKRNLLSPKIDKTTSLVSNRIRSQALQFADTVLALLPDWTSSCLHLLRFANAAASRKEVNLKYLSSLGCIDAAFVNRIDAEKSHVVGPLLSCACLLACEIPNQGAMGLPLCDHADSILEVVEQLSRRVVDGEFTRTIGRSLKLARDTIGIRDDDDDEEASEDDDDDDDDSKNKNNKNKSSSSSSLQSVWPLFCRRAASIRNALGTRAAFSVLQLLSEDGNETLNPLLKLRLFSRQTVSVLKSSVSYDY